MNEVWSSIDEITQDFPEDKRLLVGAGFAGSLFGAELAHVLADETEDHDAIEFGMGCRQDLGFVAGSCGVVESVLDRVSSSAFAVPHHPDGAVVGGSFSLAVALGASWFMNKLIREGID